MDMSQVAESETDLFRQRKCACDPVWCCGILVPRRYLMMMYLFSAQTILMAVIEADENVYEAGYTTERNILEESLCWPDNSTYFMKPYFPVHYLTEPVEGLLLDWSELHMLLNMFAFPAGYGLGHMPGTILAEKYGGKLLIFASVFLCTSLHLVTPLILHDSEWYHILCLKFIQGIVLGPFYPIIVGLIVKWAPMTERASMFSVIVAGRDTAFLLATLVTIIFIEFMDVWQGVQYCMVAMAWLWLIVFSVRCTIEPRDDPYITKDEVQLIEGGYKQSQLLSSKIKATPFLQLITNLPMLLFLLSSGIQHFSKLIYSQFVTLYLRDVLNVHPSAIVAMSCVRVTASFFGCIISGVLCDYCIRHKLVKFENSKRYFLCLSSGGLGLCSLPIIYHNCSIPQVYTFVVIAGFLLGMHGCILRVNILDLSRNYCGTIMGLTQGFSYIISDVILVILFLVLSVEEEEGYEQLMFTLMGMNLVNGFIEYMFTTTQEQPFNYHVSKKERLKQSPMYPARF